MVEVSPEQIDQADADVVFYAGYGEPGEVQARPGPAARCGRT